MHGKRDNGIPHVDQSLTVCSFCRPHVVGAKWLLECFSKGYILPEEPYIHTNYQPAGIPVSDQPAHQTVVLEKSSTFSKKDFAPNEKLQQADEDLLAQYVNNDSTVGKK